MRVRDKADSSRHGGGCGLFGFEGFEDGWLGRGVFLSTYAGI